MTVRRCSTVCLEAEQAQFPPEALPSGVLVWWLLSRGCECDEDTNRGVILNSVNIFRRMGRLVEAHVYRTTYSVTLQSLLGTSPRIPLVEWVADPTVWQVCSPGETQNVQVLKAALNRCVFTANDEGSTHKERIKANTMNRDGHVFWANLTMRNGQARVNGIETFVTQFTLQCAPSMKADRYDVEIVFVQKGSRGMCHDWNLGYCTCKRGAIATEVCAHRRAVFYWLRTFRQKWLHKDTSASNFHDVAAVLGLPMDVLEACRLPLSVPSIISIQNQKKRKQPWSTTQASEVRASNKRYIDEGLSQSSRDFCLQTVGAIRQSHGVGLALERYPLLAAFACLMDSGKAGTEPWKKKSNT